MSVGIVGPKGPGPLKDTVSLATNIKENSPPEGINIEVDPKTSELVVTWHHR